jgi:argininosuccinate synthase
VLAYSGDLDTSVIVPWLRENKGFELICTFGEEDVYNQQDAMGFINLFGLPMKMKAMLDMENAHKRDIAAPDYSKFKRDEVTGEYIARRPSPH